MRNVIIVEKINLEHGELTPSTKCIFTIELYNHGRRWRIPGKHVYIYLNTYDIFFYALLSRIYLRKSLKHFGSVRLSPRMNSSRAADRLRYNVLFCYLCSFSCCLLIIAPGSRSPSICFAALCPECLRPLCVDCLQTAAGPWVSGNLVQPRWSSPLRFSCQHRESKETVLCS